MLSMISIVETEWSMRTIWMNHSQLDHDPLRWYPHSQCCNWHTSHRKRPVVEVETEERQTEVMFDLEASTLTPFIRCTEMGDALPGGVFFIYWRAHIYIFDGKTITWKEAVELFAALVPSHRVDRRGGGVGAVQSGVSTQLNSFFFIFYCLLRQPLFSTQLNSFFYIFFRGNPLLLLRKVTNAPGHTWARSPQPLQVQGWEGGAGRDLF